MLRILDPADGFVRTMPRCAVIPLVIEYGVVAHQLPDFPALVCERRRQGLERAICAGEAGGVRIRYLYEPRKPWRGAARMSGFHRQVTGAVVIYAQGRIRCRRRRTWAS